MMKNLVIAIIIVIAGSLTFLLIQKLNIQEIDTEEEVVQEEGQPTVASGEYLAYERFDPQYYSENRIVYIMMDGSMSELDADINSNMLLIPEGMVLVRTDEQYIPELRSNLSLNPDTNIVEVDNEGRVVNVFSNISSLSQLLGELGY
jgi:hypothetical protein